MNETNQPQPAIQPEATAPVLSKKVNNQVLIIAGLIALVAILLVAVIVMIFASKGSSPANTFSTSNNNSIQPLTLNNMPTIVSTPLVPHTVVSSPLNQENSVPNKTFTFTFNKPYNLSERLDFSIEAPSDSKVEVTSNAAGWPISNITNGSKELQVVFPYESFPTQYFQNYSIDTSNLYWGSIYRVAKQDGTTLTQYYTNDLSQTSCQSTDGSLSAPCGSGVMTDNLSQVALSVSCVTPGDGDFSFCDTVAPTIKVTKTDL